MKTLAQKESELQESSKRMSEILEEKRLSAGRFERTIGVGPGVIRNILIGRNKISFEVGSAICRKFPEYSFNWITKGTLPKLGDGSVPVEENGTCPTCKVKDIEISKLLELFAEMTERYTKIIEQHERTNKQQSDLIDKLMK